LRHRTEGFILIFPFGITLMRLPKGAQMYCFYTDRQKFSVQTI